MAKKAKQPKEPRQFGRIMKHFVVGGVIASGAVLWGFAVYHVAMRTL